MSALSTFAPELSRTTNPFSTRWVRPGALPYQFPAGVSAARIVHRLRNSAWRGSIIGPHGSGKSALLATLSAEIEHSGRAVRSVTLHDGQRNLPSHFTWPSRDELPGLIVVDGYEQLGWLARYQLNLRCRRSGWGLLITAHSDARARGFLVLFRTIADLAIVAHLIDRHLPPHGGLIQPDDIAVAFRAHRGNVRDTFFALYDLFQHRQRAGARETASV